MKDQTPEQRELDRIRELLDVTAPRNADTAGRADAVAARGRRSRTRRGALSGVVVAVVAATVIVGPHFLKSSPTTNEATDPTNGVSTGSEVDPLADPCPKQDGLYAGTVDKSLIKTSASSIRLCAVILSGMPTDRWRPPQDALVDTSGFFAAVADLAPADPGRCAAANPAPDPMVFQVGFPDGAVDQAFARDICAAVLVGGTAYNVQDVLGAFNDALAAQRAELDPPQLTPSTRTQCVYPFDVNGGDSVVLAGFTRGPEPDRNTTFTAFVICADEVPIDAAAALPMLNAEWREKAGGPEPAPTCPADSEPDDRPGYAVTSWGDVKPISFGDCGTLSIGNRRILPSPKLLHALGG